MNQVPGSLRKWFVVHFIADMLVGIPLFIAPHFLLQLLGWKEIDPVTARIVAAALFGIGTQSLLGRNETVDVFRAMLNLKLIWSASVIVGILISQLQGGPPAAWIFLAIFAVFFVLWLRYRLLLGSPAAQPAS